MNVASLDAIFDELTAGAQAGAVVRIERLSTGGLLFERSAGLLRMHTRPMSVADRFHLASIAKTMTATLVLQLAEEGKFGPAGIDAPLASTGALGADVMDRLLVVDGERCAHRLTLRHLLQHTGGMRDAMVDDRDGLGGPAPRSLIGRLLSGQTSPAHRWTAWDPQRPDVPEAGVLNHYLHEVADAGIAIPGTAFHYSDTGYVVLGLVIEATAGVPLHEAFGQRLFAPLGLTQTYLAYTGDPCGMAGDRMPESEPWFGPLPSLSAGVSLSFDWAGGGVVTTTAELAVFLRGLLRGRLFHRADTLAQMTAWATPAGLQAPRTGVGLGLFRTSLQGLELIGHSGAWGAKMFAAPQRDLLLTGTLNNARAPEDWHARLLAALPASTH